MGSFIAIDGSMQQTKDNEQPTTCAVQQTCAVQPTTCAVQQTCAVQPTTCAVQQTTCAMHSSRSPCVRACVRVHACKGVELACASARVGVSARVGRCVRVWHCPCADVTLRGATAARCVRVPLARAYARRARHASAPSSCNKRGQRCPASSIRFDACALLARRTLSATSMYLAHGSVEGTHYAARCLLAWCLLAWCRQLGRAGHPRAFCISTSARSCTSSATTGAWPPCGTATIRAPRAHAAGNGAGPWPPSARVPRAASRHPIAAPTLLRSTHAHTHTHKHTQPATSNGQHATCNQPPR
jgi:hypothetical protein